MSDNGFSHVSFSAMMGDAKANAMALNGAGYNGYLEIERSGMIALNKHAGARPHQIFLEHLVKIGNPKLLAQLFRNHGAQHYDRMLTIDMIDQIIASDAENLRLLVKMGFDLKSFYGRIINQAIEGDYPEIIKIWQDDLGRSGKLIQDGGSLNILDFATPRTASVLEIEIKHTLQIPTYQRQCGFSAYRASLTKVYASLLLAGMPVDKHQVDKLKCYGIEQKRMMSIINRWTGSNHQRLAMIKSEPSLVDVLGRSPNAGFFLPDNDEATT